MTDLPSVTPDIPVAVTQDAVNVIQDDAVNVINIPEVGPPGPQGPPGAGLTGPPGPMGPQGTSVRYGVGPPASTTGADGDFYIDTAANFIYGPKAAGVWPSGVSLVGPQGPRGNSVLYGAGAPAAATGINGDFYINTTNNFIYGPKASGAWPAGVSLIGPQGSQGIQGIQGIQGVRGSLFYTGAGAPGTITGQLNGDNYLNTTTGDVYTLSGVWTLSGNIKGPQGPVGPAGGGTVIISDTPPTGVIDNTLWWESDTGVLYVRYNDGDSTQWVVASPSPDVSQTVRFDAAQSLTATQQAQARANIYAAPGNLLAFSGLQINGGFEVTQERAPGVGVPGTSYVVDGWQATRAGTSAGYAFLGGAYFSGMANCLGAYITTAQAVMGAGDYYTFYQPIEGYRVQRLGWGGGMAQPITVVFWSAHHRTGVYTGVVKNGAVNRSYAFAYTHNVSDAAQYNIVTIPGDTAGTWAKDNTTGLYVQFSMAAGSTYTAPSLNTWVAGNFVAGPGQVNAVAATTDYFRLGGVMVLPGNYGPAQEVAPSILRPFNQELIACQRYYEKSFNYETAPAVNSGTVGIAGFSQVIAGAAAQWGSGVHFSVAKRSTPTVTIYNPSAADNQFWCPAVTASWSGCGGGYPGETGFTPSGTGPAGSVQGSGAIFHWVADARLQ